MSNEEWDPLDRLVSRDGTRGCSLRRGEARRGRIDERPRVAVFCASDFAALMTGSTLLVDAGVMAT